MYWVKLYIYKTQLKVTQNRFIFDSVLVRYESYLCKYLLDFI
jgi:hypothetical protein